MKIIMLLVTLILPFTASAESTHDMFINGCQAYVSSYSLKTKKIEESDQLSIGYCLGLVDGVSKTVYYYNDKKVCFPEEPSPTLNDFVNVVMAYVHKDPDRIKKLSSMSIYSTSDLVHMALIEKYSCNK